MNIFVVWMLTGLWHGAEWNFVIWGLYFGVLLLIEKYLLHNFLGRHKVFGTIYTLFLVVISFLIFDANGLGQAMSNISGMFGWGKMPFITGETLYYLRSYGITFLVACIGATPLLRSKIKGKSKVVQVAEPIVLVLIILVVTGYLVDGSFNPFLYFRF